MLGGTLGVVGLSFIQRSILKLLLQYKGFMRLEHGQKPSSAMKLWFLLVKTLSGRKPATYNFQGVLPCLPVPPLRQTCEKYLLTVKPLLSAEEFAEMERKAARFLERDAWKLQAPPRIARRARRPRPRPRPPPPPPSLCTRHGRARAPRRSCSSRRARGCGPRGSGAGGRSTSTSSAATRS